MEACSEPVSLNAVPDSRAEGRSLGFPLEAAEGLCVVGEFVGQELQGNVAGRRA